MSMRAGRTTQVSAAGESVCLHNKLALCFMLLSLLLTGCEPGSDNRIATKQPVGFQSGDECHVCGMLIVRFPGPKAEAVVTRVDQPLKFCSTRDLFAWVLQPETAAIVQEIYVHDMAQTDWDHPEDTRLIDARTAWFVIGSERVGAMGPTLASFGERAAARAYADNHGGRLLRFDDIDLSVMDALMPLPAAQEKAAGMKPTESQ